MSEPMKINIETFWSLIDQAKEHSDQGSRGASQWLKERLMDPGQYHALKAEMKKDIVYGDGIGYPYDAVDVMIRSMILYLTFVLAVEYTTESYNE